MGAADGTACEAARDVAGCTFGVAFGTFSACGAANEVDALALGVASGAAALDLADLAFVDTAFAVSCSSAVAASSATLAGVAVS